MLPDLPDTHAIAVLLTIVIALYLFTRENIPLETSSLLILIALVVGFEVFPYQRDGITLRASEFFTGFFFNPFPNSFIFPRCIPVSIITNFVGSTNAPATTS